LKADGNSFVEYDDVDDDEDAVNIDQEMAGSFPVQEDVSMAFEAPLSVSGPVKLPDQPPALVEDQLHISKNWTNQLLQTASPKKPNRQTLKDRQDAQADAERRPLEAAPFGTAVDIMRSLFAPQGQATQKTEVSVYIPN